MALMKKAMDKQMLEKVFLKRVGKHKHEYSYIRLVLYLGELRSKGYFFTRESMHSGEHCMEFTHFLTKSKLYLHLKKVPQAYKQTHMLMMVLDENAPLRDDEPDKTEQPMLHFYKVLMSCGLCMREGELHQVYDTALREDNTDSLLTVLAKNYYVQKRVGRINSITDAETKSCWVGEFFDEMAESEEGCYLYLVQIKKEVKEQKGAEQGRKDRNMILPEWYFMRSREPLERVSLADGIAIQLEKLEWLNYPFAEYFDLPETELMVYEGRKESFALSGENLNRVLEKLHQDGYMFRRERTYPAVSELGALTEEQTRTIDAEIGIYTEYAKYGLNRIEIEFVNQVTRERKELIVDPEEIMIGSNNARCSSIGMYTSWFRIDQACSSMYYAEKGEADLPGNTAEIVFATPVFLPLLEKYQLISSDQLRICSLMGEKEFRNLFFDFYTYISCDNEEEQSSEIIEREKEKAGKVRRIAKGLKYELVGERTGNRHNKIEIYANGERSSAICLMEKGGIYSAKYVDEFMDVREALRMYI